MGSAVAELALGSPAEGGPVRSLPWRAPPKGSSKRGPRLTVGPL